MSSFGRGDGTLTGGVLQEGTGPEGTRGARVVWVLDGKYLVVSGFER